jgi:oligopeptide/dipeptide ABC transporter ATP-binding protein
MSDAYLAPVPTLEVRNLSVEVPVDGKWVRAVDGISFSVNRGECLAIVGESGSGKSLTALAIIGLVTEGSGGRIAGGEILFRGVPAAGKEMRRLRGRQVGMVFQNPMSSLDPCYPVGDQIAETIRRHRGLRREAAWKRAVELLRSVEIPDAEIRAAQYPHEFSGGMRQRVMIAIAISCDPALLIADEPTTSLDVTIQAEIVELLKHLQSESGFSAVFISHDLSLVSEVANRAMVMYAGQIVEVASFPGLFIEPRHPYTSALVDCIPDPSTSHLGSIPGTVPSPGAWGDGCRFAPRCSYAVKACTSITDIPLDKGKLGDVRCVRAPELSLRGVG